MNLKNIILSILIIVYINPIFAAGPKKIMFIVHTETLGGKGVLPIYNEMKKKGHQVKIIAVPKIYIENIKIDIDSKFLNNFEANDVIYPCGKISPYHECEKLDSYKPDYIFTQNPYEYNGFTRMTENISLMELKKTGAKLVYLPYGPYIFFKKGVIDMRLKNVIDIVCVDSESTKEVFINQFRFPAEKLIISGYEPYHEIRELMKFHTNNIKETILWLPRWHLALTEKKEFEGGSTFLNYHYFFYNYALKNPNINFIIRPHVLLYSEAVLGKHMSQEDLDNIFNRFKKLKNVKISSHANAPLTQDILDSNIVISDGTSSLAEVVVADKPIVYLSNGMNNEFNNNNLAKEFRKYIYFAYSPTEILENIDKIRANNYKPFEDKAPKSTYDKIEEKFSQLLGNATSREEFKKMVDPVDNPAKFISDYLYAQP